jgi:hypothetical protein
VKRMSVEERGELTERYMDGEAIGHLCTHFQRSWHTISDTLKRELGDRYPRPAPRRKGKSITLRATAETLAMAHAGPPCKRCGILLGCAPGPCGEIWDTCGWCQKEVGG